MSLNISLSDLPEPYRKQATEKIISQMKKKQPTATQIPQKEKKAEKLHNKKVERCGKTFDSIKEADRYDELLLMERQGVICNLEWQKKFPLLPAQYKTVIRYGKNGARLKDGQKLVERAVDYYADFVYEKDGILVVEDVKGYRNPSSAAYAKFVLKRKMMLYFHGIEITEI